MIDQDKRGNLIWGEGSLQGWSLEAGPYIERERTVRNALLAALRAEDQGEPDKAARVLLLTLPSGKAVWEVIQEGLGHWATRLRNEAIRESSDELAALPEKKEPAVGAAGYTLEPRKVALMRDEMTSFTGHQPIKHVHKRDEFQTIVWQWHDANNQPSLKVFLAVEVHSPTRKARKLEELPEWVPGQTRRMMEQSRKLLKAKLEAQKKESLGKTLQEDLDRLCEQKGIPPAIKLRQPLPGEAWLAEINGLANPPHEGVARSSRNGDRSCELCMAPVTKGEDFIATRSSSRRRAHLACYNTRQPSYNGGTK